MLFLHKILDNIHSFSYPMAIVGVLYGRNLAAFLKIVVREHPLSSDCADYLLFVHGKAVGSE